MGEGDTVLNSLIGAAVSVVLSFTTVSPVLGGGVAGYLQGGDYDEGIKVGVLSGVISVIPVLLLFSLFGSFLFAGSLYGGGIGASGGILFIFLIMILFSAVWTVGLSAVGGYLGVYIATETQFGQSGTQNW